MRDVVVVGAGPAGSSVALRLARAGYDVALLERSRFPRMKVCGDYLCAGGVNLLTELEVAETVLEGAHAIKTVALHGFGEHLHVMLPGPGALSLARSVLDERLVATALRAGVHLVHGAFLRADPERHHVCVHFRDAGGGEGTIAARVLVGADGAWSAVAQRCGLAPKRRRTGRWAVGGQLRDQRPSSELELFIGSQGYYARNPLSATVTNSMLVLPTPVRPREADGVVADITGGERRFEPEKIDRAVAIGPLTYRAEQVMRGRVVLTGDAAELLDPFTGQGVTTALALSRPAAHAVGELLAGNDELRVAQRYRAAWHGIVAPRRTLGALVSAMVRVSFIRRRALRSFRRDAALMAELLAGVSGLLPANAALAPTLWRLLVA